MLTEKLKDLLATVFVYYYKAHAFHWNVVGSTFSQDHAFFAEIYEDAHGSVDVLAEHVRILGGYPQVSLARIIQTSVVTEESNIPDRVVMFRALQSDNQLVLSKLKEVCALAEGANEKGLCNYLEERIDIHSKFSWQIGAHLLS